MQSCNFSSFPYLDSSVFDDTCHLDGRLHFCHSIGLPPYATSLYKEQNPTNTYTPSDLFYPSLSGLVASGREGLTNNVSGISTCASQRIPSSGSLYQIEEEGQLSNLGVGCSIPSSHIAATSPLDGPFSLSSVPELVSTSQNVVALSNFSSAPENIHSGISFPEVVSDTPANATSVSQPFRGGFSIAATNTRQHLLPEDPASYNTCPTPQTPKSFSSIKEIPWTGLQHTSRSSDDSLGGSTSTTTQSNPNASGTASPNTIQCTWAVCSKTFLTRSEYK